ncbi:MAG: hypothetical protein KGN84_20890, partial [Acidobacteriota bacterium]|nr:hypothetical protein [Acidobacteriota bacterium]
MRDSSTPLSAIGDRTRVTRAFPVCDRETLWVVEEGKLDLFLAPVEDGEATGAMTHVLRVESGQALFSLPGPQASSYGFLAAPAADTTLREMPVDSLPRAEMEMFSSVWIASLSTATGEPSPAETAHLAVFHERAVRRVVERRLEEDRIVSARLEARIAADRKLVGTAIRRLSISRIGASASGPAIDDCGNAPIARACQAAAAASGMELRIPRSVIQGTARSPLQAIARASSIRVRSLVLLDNWWTRDSGPMVALLEADNRYVALLPRKGGYDLFNPADESTTRIGKEAARLLTGVAWMLYRPLPARAL